MMIHHRDWRQVLQLLQEHKPYLGLLNQLMRVCKTLNGSATALKKKNATLYMVLSTSSTRAVAHRLHAMLQCAYLREGKAGLVRELTTQRLGTTFESADYTVMHHMFSDCNDCCNELRWLCSKLVGSSRDLLMALPLDILAKRSPILLRDAVKCLLMLIVEEPHLLRDIVRNALRSCIAKWWSPKYTDSVRDTRESVACMYAIRGLLPGCMPDLSDGYPTVERVTYMLQSMLGTASGPNFRGIQMGVEIAREVVSDADTAARVMDACGADLLQVLCRSREDLVRRRECTSIVMDMWTNGMLL